MNPGRASTDHIVSFHHEGPPGSSREYVYGYLSWMWPLRDDPVIRNALRVLFQTWRTIGGR